MNYFKTISIVLVAAVGLNMAMIATSVADSEDGVADEKPISRAQRNWQKAATRSRAKAKENRELDQRVLQRQLEDGFTLKQIEYTEAVEEISAYIKATKDAQECFNGAKVEFQNRVKYIRRTMDGAYKYETEEKEAESEIDLAISKASYEISTLEKRLALLKHKQAAFDAFSKDKMACVKGEAQSSKKKNVLLAVSPDDFETIAINVGRENTNFRKVCNELPRNVLVEDEEFSKYRFLEATVKNGRVFYQNIWLWDMWRIDLVPEGLYLDEQGNMKPGCITYTSQGVAFKAANRKAMLDLGNFTVDAFLATL